MTTSAPVKWQVKSLQLQRPENVFFDGKGYRRPNATSAFCPPTPGAGVAERRR
jgi:hypothetical protein